MVRDFIYKIEIYPKENANAKKWKRRVHIQSYVRTLTMILMTSPRGHVKYHSCVKTLQISNKALIFWAYLNFNSGPKLKRNISSALSECAWFISLERSSGCFISTEFGLKEFNVKSKKERITRYRRYVYETGAIGHPEKMQAKIINDRCSR